MSVLSKEQRSRIMEEAINELDVITESDWFKDLVEEKRLELVDLDTISECSTFEARGNSFEASDGNHDDLVMNLVMFAWYVGSEAFVNQTDMTIKQMLYEQRNKEIEDDIVPVGIIDDGVDRDETEVIGGDVWTSERTEMF